MEKLNITDSFEDTIKHLIELCDKHDVEVVLQAIDEVSRNDSKKEPPQIRLLNLQARYKIIDKRLQERN